MPVLFHRLCVTMISGDNFYPTALKGCQGIVFTHSVRMDGRAMEEVCLACISETVRCRKLIHGRDIG